MINLVKASRLVDDKSTLVADPTSANSGSKNRRKSAFSEEDDGYQYVEEGFRVRFANGETIDFYADSKAAKDEWMGVLSQVIGKPDAGQKEARWTDLVLTRERAERQPAPSSDGTGSSSPMKQGMDVHDFTKPSRPQPARQLSDRKAVAKSAPTSPVKGPPERRAPGPPPAAVRPTTPPMKARSGHRSRDAVKSMIF